MSRAAVAPRESPSADRSPPPLSGRGRGAAGRRTAVRRSGPPAGSATIPPPRTSRYGYDRAPRGYHGPFSELEQRGGQVLAMERRPTRLQRPVRRGRRGCTGRVSCLSEGLAGRRVPVRGREELDTGAAALPARARRTARREAP